MADLTIVPCTLPEEGGASLRGAGWVCLGETGGGTWHRPYRPRTDKHPTGIKVRWQVEQPGDYPRITWPQVDEAETPQLCLPGVLDG